MGQMGKKAIAGNLVSLVIVSGILCFVLDENWVRLSSGAKVPLYTCFALVFSSIDVLNWCIGSCQSANAKAIVETLPRLNIRRIRCHGSSIWFSHLWFPRR